MERTISATEARVHFGQLMRRVVENGEAVFVERSGKPQVVVISVAEYERLTEGRPETEDWWTLVEESREAIQRGLNGRPMPPIEDIIHEMREERDTQIMANLEIVQTE